MIYRIQQGVATVALVALSLGCMAQRTQSREPQLASEHRAQIAQKRQTAPNHVCMGEACGPTTLVANWTLGDPMTMRDEDWVLAISDCRGTVCGPMTDVSTWLLPEPPGGYQCLGTVCGAMVPPTNWTAEYRQSAGSQSQLPHRQ